MTQEQLNIIKIAIVDLGIRVRSPVGVLMGMSALEIEKPAEITEDELLCFQKQMITRMNELVGCRINSNDLLGARADYWETEQGQNNKVTISEYVKGVLTRKK